MVLNLYCALKNLLYLEMQSWAMKVPFYWQPLVQSSNTLKVLPLITDLQKVTSRSFDRFRARRTQAAPQPVEKLDQSV